MEPISVSELLAHESFIRSLALSLTTDAHDADDVVQETWIAALQHAPRRRASLRSWLAAIVRHRVQGSRREEARRVGRERAAARAEAVPSTDVLVDRLLTQRALVEAVVELDVPYREVVLLRFYEGLSSVAIARHLDIPAATVRTRLRRALAQLRGRLDRGHPGGRAGWLGAMLAWPKRPKAALWTGTPSFALIGVALMTLKSKVMVASFLVLTTLALWWAVELAGDAADPLDGSPAAGLSALDPLDREKAMRSLASAYQVDRQADSPAGADFASSEEKATAERGTGALEVKTIWKDDGSPAPHIGIAVSIGEAPRARLTRLATDRFGHALKPDLLVGRIEVRVNGLSSPDAENPRYQVYGQTFDREIRAEERVTLEIALDRGLVVDGLVVDHEGRPVAGAVVYAAMGPTRPWPDFCFTLARSDTDGRFELQGLSSLHSVGARAMGHAPSLAYLLWNEEGTLPGKRIQLRISLRGPSGSLVGRVVDSSGSPCAGALVAVRPLDALHSATLEESLHIQPPPPLEVRTDEAGGFSAADLAPGAQLVRVQTTPFGRWERVVEIEPSSTTHVEIVLERSAMLEGRVTDESGAAVGDAEIRVESDGSYFSAETDESGRYVIEHLPPGSVEVTASSVWTDATKRLEGKTGQRLRWDPVLKNDAVSARVTGALLGPEGEVPPAARVDLVRTHSTSPLRTAAADATTARFLSDAVPPGRYRIIASARGYPDISLGEHELEADQLLDLGSFRWEEPGWLEVHVEHRELSSGGPLQVWVYRDDRPGGGGERIHLKGRSGVSEPLRAGDYTVQVWGEGAAPVRKPVHLEEGMTAKLELVIEPGATRTLQIVAPKDVATNALDIVVTGATGEPVLRAATGRRYLQVSGEPVFLLTASFAPGTYRVEARDGERAIASGTFEVDARPDSYDTVRVR